MNYKHKILLSITLGIYGISFTTVSMANPKIEAAKRCLGDNTTGKERKELAKWIFIAIAAHPEIRDLSNVTPDISDKSSQSTGLLMNSLILDKCSQEMRALISESGPSAVELPFKFLGELAMKELMTDPSVTASIQGFIRYYDKEKADKVLKVK
jgi:hypothetical protein